MDPFRLGLFGGTFDPPHIGHLVVAQDAVEALGLHRLLLIPAKLPPHKTDRVISPAHLRLEMARAAVVEDEAMGVSDVELDREGPSYTVDTLEHFRSLHADRELFFLMGEDQLREIHLWHEVDRLAGLARIVVMARDGVEPGDTAPELEIEYHRIPVTRIDLSSSQIRRRRKEGRSIRHLVPTLVRQIIEQHRLYRDTETTT